MSAYFTICLTRIQCAADAVRRSRGNWALELRWRRVGLRTCAQQFGRLQAARAMRLPLSGGAAAGFGGFRLNRAVAGLGLLPALGARFRCPARGGGEATARGGCQAAVGAQVRIWNLEPLQAAVALNSPPGRQIRCANRARAKRAAVAVAVGWPAPEEWERRRRRENGLRKGSDAGAPAPACCNLQPTRRWPHLQPIVSRAGQQQLSIVRSPQDPGRCCRRCCARRRPALEPRAAQALWLALVSPLRPLYAHTKRSFSPPPPPRQRTTKTSHLSHSNQ